MLAAEVIIRFLREGERMRQTPIGRVVALCAVASMGVALNHLRLRRAEDEFD